MTNVDSSRGASSLVEQTTSPTQQRAVGIACVGYVILVLALLPFAAHRLPAVPQITNVYATVVFVADVCTFVLLAGQYRVAGVQWLLLLSCAYLYSAAMAVLHLLSFPGALMPEVPILGNGQAVGWLYTFWNLGFVALLLTAAIVTPRMAPPLPRTERRTAQLVAASVTVLGLTALLALLATLDFPWLPNLMSRDQFAASSIELNAVRGVLALTALLFLWKSGRTATVIPLWLCLTLVASATGPLLTDLGGRRYTFGWYAGRAGFAFASWVLLAALLTEFMRLHGVLEQTLARLRYQAEALTAEVQRREAAETDNVSIRQRQELAEQAQEMLRAAYLDTRNRQREAESLAAVARTINTLELGAVLQNIAESAASLLNADVAAVFRLDAVGENLVLLATGGPRGSALEPNVSMPRGTGLIWLAIQQRETVVSHDLLTDSRLAFTPDMRARIQAARHRAGIAVPLLAQGRTTGALFVGALPGRRFSTDETRLVTTFADQAAVAMANAELYVEVRQSKGQAEAARDELSRSVAALTILADLSTRLVRKGELQAPLLDILDAGIRITGADMGNIQLRHADTGHLEIAVQRGFQREFLEFFAVVHDREAACGTAMITGQRVIVDDIATDPLFDHGEARGVLLRAGVRAVQSTPLRNRAGELIGMLSTHYHAQRQPEARDLYLLDMLGRLAADYIERARTEREEAATQARLEAADRAKDEFIAMLSHELRNPIGAIVAAIGVLDVANGSADAVARAHAVIARQGKHLSRLVDDLLDVSRVTSGKVRLSRIALDLGALLDHAVARWRDAGRFQRHQLSVDVVPVWIEADATRIEQILDNLVGNAVKYTPAGGCISLRVRDDDDAAILEVADTGIGMPPALLDEVFDLFVQGAHGIDRADGGLGIGLTLVKTLTTLHGGTVTAASDGPGKGSVFTVRLPSKPVAAST
jgi:signal transduction histidine kinase